MNKSYKVRHVSATQKRQPGATNQKNALKKTALCGTALVFE